MFKSEIISAISLSTFRLLFSATCIGLCIGVSEYLLYILLAIEIGLFNYAVSEMVEAITEKAQVSTSNMAKTTTRSFGQF